MFAIRRNVVGCLSLLCAGILAGCTTTITPPREPLVPTPVTQQAVTPSPNATTALPDPEPIPTAAPAPDLPTPYTLRWRAGVGVPDGKSPLIYPWPEPRPGWYLNWSAGFTSTVWLSNTVTQPLDFHIPPDAVVGM